MHIKKTVNIPKALIEQAVRLSGATTQTMAIIMGLQELIRKKRLEALLKLRGHIKLSQTELKKMRSR